MLIPSKVEVPLPISSRISKLFEVAFLMILATSLISTIKVDCPDARSSDAPTRVKMLSTIPISAEDAGTNGASFNRASTTGCLESLILIAVERFTSGLMYLLSAATFASDVITSRLAMAFAVF